MSPEAGDPTTVTQKEADSILRICAKVKRGAVSAGHRRLMFGNWCGVIQVGGLTIEILPKVADSDEYDRGVLLRMLAVANDFPVTELGSASLERQSHTLLHWIVRW